MKTIIFSIASFLLFALMPLHAQEIFKAISTGNLEQVKSIISETPELINAKNEKMGLTAVEMAFMVELQKKKLEIAPYLIENGAQFDVNKKFRTGYTTLDMAIVFGYYEAAEYLIKLGADINSISERDGKTHLINAITRNREKIVILLIMNNADINIPDIDGRPPIYYAVNMGQSEVVQKLLDREVKVNFIDDSGRSLLHIASLNGYCKIVEMLLGRNMDINALDKACNSALYYAAKYGHKKTANLLTDQGDLKNKGIEKNYGKSIYLTKKLSNGDAVAWYLSNRGGAVKTQNHAYHGEIGEPAYIHTIEDSVGIPA